MATRFAFFYAALFLVIGILMPFWPAWFASRGLDAGEISLLISIGIWIRVIASPVLAHWADRSGAHRAIMLVAATGAAGCFALFDYVNSFWVVLPLNIVASVLFMALIPLGENLASRSSRSHGFDYGRVRLWGSVAFILSAYAGGVLIEELGDSIIPWMVVACVVGTSLAVSRLPRRLAGRQDRPRFPLGSLLRNRNFLIFLLAASCIQASHAILYVFGTIHWRAAGLSDVVIGALWAEGVAAEIVLFAFSGAVVRRIDPLKLMAIAACAGLVRWTVLAETTDVAMLVAVQWLHGLTFGAAHLAAMFHMLRTIPDQLSASAQSLYSGLAVGLVMGLVMLGGGYLYEAVGAAAFHAMTLLSAGGGVVVAWLAVRARRETALL